MYTKIIKQKTDVGKNTLGGVNVFRLRMIMVLSLLVLIAFLSACANKEKTVENVSTPLFEKAAKPQILSVKPLSKHLIKDEVFQITVGTYNSHCEKINFSKVDYKSSNPQVAHIDSGGRVSALNIGDAVITVSAENLSVNSNITVFKDKNEKENYEAESGDAPDEYFTNTSISMFAGPIGGNIRKYDPTKPVIVFFSILNKSKDPIIIDPAYITFVDENDTTLLPDFSIYEGTRRNSPFKRVTILPGKKGGGEVAVKMKAAQGGMIKMKEVIYNDGKTLIRINTQDWVY